jgi:hypothetical protein
LDEGLVKSETKYNGNLNINYKDNKEFLSLIRRKHMNYIYVMRQLDNVKNKGLNYIDDNMFMDKNRNNNLKTIKLFNVKNEKGICTIRKT